MLIMSYADQDTLAPSSWDPPLPFLQVLPKLFSLETRSETRPSGHRDPALLFFHRLLGKLSVKGRVGICYHSLES